VSTATLQGVAVTACRVQIPAWGVWYADVQTSGDAVLAGRVTLVLADLTLTGTVLSGGSRQGRGSWRVVGGAGGWGREIAAQSEANDAGVKASVVLAKAAALAGETMGTVPTGTVGPAWARPVGVASAALNLIYPRGWYVDSAGVTQIGARASAVYVGQAIRLDGTDLALGKIELAAESIAALLPGAVVDGVDAVDVEHVLDGGKLRTTVWGAGVVAGARRPWSELIEAALPWLRFAGTWEYRVVTQSGERLNLQPVRVVTGMPDLRSVKVRPGLPGAKAEHALGSCVLVSFVDADPARPVVVGFEDADGEGFAPDTLDLETAAHTGAAAPVGTVVRVGDLVTVGIANGALAIAGAYSGVRAP
jgi:hypothetical protein